MDDEDADAAIGLSFLAIAAGAKVLRTTLGHSQTVSGSKLSEVRAALTRLNAY
jgi:hypothetical protein